MSSSFVFLFLMLPAGCAAVCAVPITAAMAAAIAAFQRPAPGAEGEKRAQRNHGQQNIIQRAHYSSLASE